MKLALAGTVTARFLRKLVQLPSAGSRGQTVGAVALAVVAAASGTQITMDRLSALPADAIFRTSGEVMTNQEFDRRLHILTAVYGVGVPSDPAAKAQFDRDAAKAVAVTDIVDQAAREQGIVVADNSAQDKLNTVIQQTPGGRDAFVSQIGSVGLSEGDVLTEIKRTIASSQLFDKITANVPAPTDQAVQQYYDTHTADMAVPQSRDIHNIVVADQSTAQDILNQAKAGADFATLASQKSLDQTTKDKGGDLGSVTAVQLDSGYATAAFAAPQGGLFGPVQTQYGWNVGQVVSITPAQPRTLAQVHDQLKSELQTSAKNKEWLSWLTDRIKAAKVEYADAYRPADPDSPPPDMSQAQP